MAAGVISSPGTKYGPCEEPCSHRDCAGTRRMAAVVCRFCDKPISYDRRFYNEGAPGSYDLVHAVCLEESVDV